jgi:hypothetical protein
MFIHGFGVFDLRYRYRSMSTYFRFDGFVFDVSVFHYGIIFDHIISVSFPGKKYDRK